MNRLFVIIAAMAVMLCSVPAVAQETLRDSVENTSAVVVGNVVESADNCETTAVSSVCNSDSIAAVEPVVEESFMEKLVRVCLENLNYGTVTLFMAIESSFIPFPSEAVVPPAAWKATVSGEMNIFLVVLFATIGALIGALLNYYLALWLGRPLVYKFANSRLGHMCLLDEAKVQKAEAYFEKHGAASTFIGRLVPAVRQLISIPAGLARMNLPRFILYTSLGAGAWNVILAALGYYMSTFESLKTEEDVMIAVKKYSSEIGMVFIVLVVLIIGFLIYKGCKSKKKA